MPDGLVLVTGGAGFIGSSIARAVLAGGAAVRVFDNLSTGVAEAVPQGAEFQLGDIRDADALSRACEGVDLVYHEAAQVSVPKSVEDPALTEECNAAGTLNVLQAAERAGVRRVVYASSSSVYGETTGINREDASPNPESPYAVAKLSGEQYCRVWTRLKCLSTVSLRYFNVFGPGQRLESRYAMLFPGLVTALEGNRSPEIHWDGEQSRDFTYISDVVRANLMAAACTDPRADGSTFNIGSGQAKTVNETFNLISDLLGVQIEPLRIPKRPGDVRSTLADVSRAWEVLGWAPQTSWQDAVRATVAWFTAGAGTGADNP